MRGLAKFVLSLVIIAITFDIQAKQLADIYSAKVPVNSRGQSDYKSAVNDALVQVLSKSSGQSEAKIRSLSVLATDLKQADKWVEQFSYISTPAEDGKANLSLSVNFGEKYVTGLLKLGQLPYWSANRPQTLLIVLRNENGKVTLVNEDPDVKSMIQKYNHRFGLVTVSPDWRTAKKMDLPRTWAMDEVAIELATNLQEKDATLVLRLKNQSFETIEADWLLLEDDSQRSGSSMSASLEDSFHSAYQWLSGQWSKQYAIQLTTDTNEFILSISNIESFKDYMNVLNYLQRLEVVRSVFLLGTSQSSVNLAVSLNTGWERFNQLLVHSDRLVPENHLTDEHIHHFWWKH